MQRHTSAEIKVISLEMFRLQNFDVVLSEVRYFFSFVGNSWLHLYSSRTFVSSYGSQGQYILSGKEKVSRLISAGQKTQEEYIVFINPDLCLPCHDIASSGLSVNKPCAAQTLPASFPQEVQFLLGFYS